MRKLAYFERWRKSIPQPREVGYGNHDVEVQTNDRVSVSIDTLASDDALAHA